MLQKLLDEIREASSIQRDRGDDFERLIRQYLKTDPQYTALFEDVWMWKDWPHRESLGFKTPDTGVDLVAKMRDAEGFCGIQCKFYENSIAQSELGNFMTLTGKGHFVQRMIVATAPLTKNAEDAIEGQTIPVSLITLEDLEAAPIDWSKVTLAKPEAIKLKTKKAPRPHQAEARDNVIKGFAKSKRGKLVMACGTGKTYTAQVITEQMVAPGDAVLFMVPSIALLSQTLRSWTGDATVPLRCYAVCSDSKASRNEDDIRIFELAYPATTNDKALAQSLKAKHGKDAITVIFSTYQSIETVYRAQQASGIKFKLVICDEAHRTAGYTAPGDDPSAFVLIHDENYIQADKRLYMTATPRIYAEASRSRAEELDVQVFSMDDPKTFGPEFHRLRFDEAVKRDLLSDYKVLVIAVDELHVSRVLNKRIADKGDELKLDDAVKIIGCWNGLGKHVASEDNSAIAADPAPMRTAIAFAQSIKHSKLLAQEFTQISDDLASELDYLPALHAQHVDGTMDVVKRNQLLAWLRENIGKEDPSCRILTNARCLSEGVDVPALDAAIFLNPRDSVTDVVQSVGRVMRKDPAGRKKYGYVILPIGIRRDASAENALDDNKKYRVVWQVLNALRAHDDRLDKEFASIDLNGKRNGVVNVIGVGGGGSKEDNLPEQLDLGLDPEELSKWSDALFAKIVHKCGNRRYWEDWAKDIAEIADRHVMRIEQILEKPHSKGKKAFDEFLKGVRKNLNPSISQADAVEMLAQHIITKPVFDALFEGYAFTTSNPVSQSMQKIMDILEAQALDKEHETLQGFYASVRERASGITDPKGRQRIVLELYDKFFKTAFPKMVEKLGIVYTPVEVVDFILHSANDALKNHFGVTLADKHVHILDPFTGTGTFMVRLMESGLIDKKSLAYKYRHELHANEIVLLAYYIAAINIEETFHRITGGQYEPFPGIVLTDTFQMFEPQTGDLDQGLPENHERVTRQKSRDIRVIVGNPPYVVGKDDSNDTSERVSYPKLDGRIGATYAQGTSAVNKNSLYNSYIRAWRWASDRVQDQGVVAFVTNGAWLDSNSADGFRKSLQDEFSKVYVYNLRGNQRTSGELSRREGGKIFGSGSRNAISITLLIKEKLHKGPAEIYYHDIGDYLSREEKLKRLVDAPSYSDLPWVQIQPNEHHDWINQRSGDFGAFIPIQESSEAIFAVRSNGVQTNRDAWVYSASGLHLKRRVKALVDFYNSQVEAHLVKISEASNSKEREKLAAQLVDTDPRKIKWTRGLIADVARGRQGSFQESQICVGLYRPFSKTWLYYDRLLNEYYKEKFYPTADHSNLAIMVTGTGAAPDFSPLITNVLPDLQGPAKCQCFPLHWYEPASEKDQQSTLGFDAAAQPDEHGFIKRDGITDVALENFRKHYKAKQISKEDIFYYVYGVLHSQEYRTQYEADLKKVLPRIPMATDFWGFSKAGRALADLHLNYETIEPWPVQEDRKPVGDLNDLAYYRIDKMRYASAGGREKDKTTIIYNSRITLRGIPLEAYDYVVNGKSAIDWVMEQYQVSTDKDSGIVNDPNEWCREHNDPAYILNLIKRVIRVSIETQKIVGSLPGIG